MLVLRLLNITIFTILTIPLFCCWRGRVFFLLSSRGCVFFFAVVPGARFFFAVVPGGAFFFCCRPWGRVFFCCRCGGAFFFGCRGGAFFFLLSSLGARFFFCCRCGGAFFFWLSWRGRVFFFAVVAGTGAHSLTGLLGPRNDNKNQHKATTAKKKNTGSDPDCLSSLIFGG